MIKALQAAGITALILLGAWAAETFIDTVRPRTALVWRALIFLGLGVLILLLSLHALGAQEHHPRASGRETDLASAQPLGSGIWSRRPRSTCKTTRAATLQ